MSILGTLVRLDRTRVDEILARRDETSLSQVRRSPDQLDLDRYWDVLRFLIERAGAPVNIVSGGVDFPDGQTDWSYFGPMRLFDAEAVGQAAQLMDDAFFERMIAHVGEIAGEDPPLYPQNWGDWTDDTTIKRLRTCYDEVAAYLRLAASEGQCVLSYTE